MFLEIAVGAIGIGIVVMVGYLIVSQVRTALPTPQETYTNACLGYELTDATFCNTSAVSCGPLTDNTSATVTCESASFASGVGSTQATVFAGFGLVAVGIIVLAAFGLINIFR